MRRLIALIASACIALLAGSIDAANVRHAQGALVVNSDGSYNEQYPNGDRPPDSGVLDFTSAGQSVLENVGTVTVTVARAAGSTGAASVVISNAGTGSATSSDYTGADLPATLNWSAADAANKSATIHITNRLNAQGTRTLVLSLGSVTGAILGTTIQTTTITIADVTVLTTTKKWHPGYYPVIQRQPSSQTQTQRFSTYDSYGSSAVITGWHFMPKWSDLEGATAGSYSAGDTMLLAEMAHLKAESVPKRLFLQINDENYRGNDTWYPAYVVSAGCTLPTTASDGNSIDYFKWWVPTCAGYMANLVAHLGSLLDSDPYFEGLVLDYEQAYAGGGPVFTTGAFNRTQFYAGVTTVVQAAAAAFPHTNLAWRANWGVTFHESDVVQLLGVMKAAGVGWGDQDACARSPTTPFAPFSNGAMPSYIDADNVFAGYGGFDSGHNAGTYTDQRGKMFSYSGVEDSELGYASVCNGSGATGTFYNSTYYSLYNWWNDSLHSSHANLDMNMETGIPQQRWSVGTASSLWDMVTNHPLTHTACPTDYDTLFGNGTVGSGCNTN